MGTDYMTPKEAAERLQVSRITIWRWISEGYFEGVRKKGLGKTSSNLIPASEVERVAIKLGIGKPEP